MSDSYGKLVLVNPNGTKQEFILVKKKVSLGRNLDARIFPHIIKFKTRLKSEMALTAFANSITLTPGTITVDIKDGYFYVHALDRSLADSLPGDMEDRIARIYGES